MSIETLTVEQIQTIISEAHEAAHEASLKFFVDTLGGVDRGACGFAWVNIYGIKGNTKLGRKLKQAGITQDYTKVFSVWNPANFPCQNVDTLLVGAREFAKILKSNGFDAYAESKLD